jgi:hypothetical protein
MTGAKSLKRLRASRNKDLVVLRRFEQSGLNLKSFETKKKGRKNMSTYERFVALAREKAEANGGDPVLIAKDPEILRLAHELGMRERAFKYMLEDQIDNALISWQKNGHSVLVSIPTDEQVRKGYFSKIYVEGEEPERDVA